MIGPKNACALNAFMAYSHITAFLVVFTNFLQPKIKETVNIYDHAWLNIIYETVKPRWDFISI
jgi:hypothetical protein